MRSVAFVLSLLILAGCAASGRVASGDDRPAEDRLLFFEDGEWQLNSRTLYTYAGASGAGASGEAAEVIEQTWGDGEWANDQRQTWTVDAQGRQTEGTFWTWTSGDWALAARAQFTYDSAGQKVGALRSLVDASGGSTTADSLVSTFDANGLETGRRFYRRQDGETVEVLRQRSDYDAMGREVRRLHLGPSEGQWTEERRWTFTHRPDGERATGQVEVMENGKWVPERSEAYVYDDRGRLVRLDVENWEEGEWRPFVRRESRYATD